MAVIQGNAHKSSVSGFYPKTINGSLRFNDDDSAYLTHSPNENPSTAGIFTFSFWFKLSNPSSPSPILYPYTDGNNFGQIALSSNQLSVYSAIGGSAKVNVKTTAVLRDYSAWYHAVIKFNSTSGNEEIKIYLNGVDQSLTTTTAMTAHTPKYGANGVTHYLGSNFNQSGLFDGYLAEVHFTDGTAYDADAFGEFKEGVWVAKAPSVTYGTNGFYLTFEDDTEVEAFNTVLYRGDGVSGRSITGMGFEPDLIWIKSRSGAQWHHLFDQVRGGSKRLHSNSTNAESTLANSQILSFDSDGYTVTEGENVNGSGISYVAWGWKAGDSNVSNTDGSITSTVRANDTYGFSIVSYTGTGSAATVGHGLTSAPDMVIVKNRDAADNWCVYHSSLGETQTLRLNATIAAFARTGSWNDTAPTSSLFTIGTDSEVNTSTQDYIAYCWAEKTGYSKFGSYSGVTGSDVSVTCGFKPAITLIKCSSTSPTNWFIHDNTRDTQPDQTYQLLANTSDAESSTGKSIEFGSNGFTVRAGGGTQINETGQTYIYAAFADTREAAFWLDQSGNDNDWQPVNLDHNDTVADSPTDNFATWNPLDSTVNNLSEGNLRVSTSTSGSRTACGSFGVSSGQWYWEVTSLGGSENLIGVVDASYSGTGSTLGYQHNGSVFYYRSGNKSIDGSFTAYGASYTTNDIIGIALDLDSGTVTFYKNNVSQGSITLPSTGTESWKPSVSSGTGTDNQVYYANFGQQPFKYDPPA